MKKYLFIALLVAVSSSASAGQYIGKAKPYYWGTALYIETQGMVITNRPACATRTLVRLVETDPLGAVFKNKFAMLLSMWTAQRDIQLKGTTYNLSGGTCTAEGDEIISVVDPQ